MKRNSKQFLALFMAVAMSVTPVSYAYAEDSAVAGVENTESGQQTVEVTDGKIGAADAAGQPAEEVTGQEEETTAGQGTDENQKSQEEPKEENAATGNVTEAEKKEAGEDGKSEEKAAEEQKVKSEETALLPVRSPRSGSFCTSGEALHNPLCGIRISHRQIGTGWSLPLLMR